jgi:CIC family chloride channel protein
MNALSLRDRLTAVYGRFWSSQTAVMLTMALVVGLGSGFAAVGFRGLIGLSRTFFSETLEMWLLALVRPQTVGTALPVIAPAVGGLIVGLIAHLAAGEVRGPGVSSVMEALALRGGRIRPIVIAARPVATAITLGSGGSAGREGPVVQVGAAIGSTLSQLVKLSDERAKNLVACGAAGGIAATFNAPLAGVMFALEVLLAEFGLVQFTSVVVAAVTASVIGHAYFGDVPAFPFPPSAAPKTWELPLFALLGIAAAFVGVAFTLILHAVDQFFDRRRLPPYAKPAVGGLAVGLLGFRFPRVLGAGYDTIEAVLFSRLALTSIVLLLVLKVAATSLTIGSGGSGGIFGPSLFIGAMLGGVFAQLTRGAAATVPVPAAAPSSYAVVGMAAVFAAVSRAPITAILTLFEMTRDYTLILPLMLASVISATVARLLLEDSIYTIKLSSQGIDVQADRRLDLMGTILVGDAMTPIEEIKTVRPSTGLAELLRIFDETHYHGLVVVDEALRLEGVVTLADLEEAQPNHLVGGTVADVQTINVRTAFPDQTLKAALQHIAALDVGRIPVVERARPRRVVGLLRRSDIVQAYSHAMLDQRARIADLDRARVQDRTGGERGDSAASTSVVEIKLREHHAAVGHSIRSLDLPPDSLIATVRRSGRVVIPRGDTQLEAGDVLVALATEPGAQALRNQLIHGAKRRSP